MPLDRRQTALAQFYRKRDAGIPRTPRVRVLPRDEVVRGILFHPSGHLGFPEETGSVEWPLDDFTQRRLRDGSVTIDGDPPIDAAKSWEQMAAERMAWTKARAEAETWRRHGDAYAVETAEHPGELAHIVPSAGPPQYPMMRSTPYPDPALVAQAEASIPSDSDYREVDKAMGAPWSAAPTPPVQAAPVPRPVPSPMAGVTPPPVAPGGIATPAPMPAVPPNYVDPQAPVPPPPEPPRPPRRA